MAAIARLKDYRKQRQPEDIGTFQFVATAMVFQFVFSGVMWFSLSPIGAILALKD